MATSPLEEMYNKRVKGEKEISRRRMPPDALKYASFILMSVVILIFVYPILSYDPFQEDSQGGTQSEKQEHNPVSKFFITKEESPNFFRLFVLGLIFYPFIEVGSRLIPELVKRGGKHD